jgi:hypothetical protein
MSQGASNNAGQGSRPTFVSFTKAAAVRINNAVLTVEKGNRTHPGLTFDHPMPGGGGKVFRVCTFTGAWSKNDAKVVTFRGVTSTPNTAVAQNIFVTISGTTATTTKNCAIARDGTAWYLISAECS